MKKPLIKQCVYGLGLALMALPVVAHPLLIEGDGFSYGLLHPLLGIDHVLIILAMGIWAVQSSAQRVWLMPALFSLVMLLGLLLTMTGVQLPLLEMLLALSVLVMGLLISFRTALTNIMGLLLITVFAIYHGYAHGVVMGVNSISVGYMVGLFLSTTVLNVVAVSTAWTLKRSYANQLHWSGLSFVGFGAVLLIGV